MGRRSPEPDELVSLLTNDGDEAHPLDAVVSETFDDSSVAAAVAAAAAVEDVQQLLVDDAHADSNPTPQAPTSMSSPPVVDTSCSEESAAAAAVATAAAAAAMISTNGTSTALILTAPPTSTTTTTAVTATVKQPSQATSTTATAVSRPPAQPFANTTSKSKKKKATPSLQSSSSNKGGGDLAVDKGENVGRWTAEEHRLFLQGLEQHGKGWKKIASLIKTRSVVQIRTHAQKYFQKLAKARQNGEEGDVTMEGRGGVSSAASVSTIVAAQTSKRRRPQPVTGTKRKVIQSIVVSAQRQGKKMALEQQAAEAVIADESAGEGGDGVSNAHVLIPPPLPTVTPILAHFILPNASAPQDGAGSPNNNNGNGNNKSTSSSCVPSISTSQGTISGPALEDSIFRFLTPVPVASSEPYVNDIARQAGANPITLPPSDHPSSAPSMGSYGGEISPTGVNDFAIYPSWTDAKDMTPPSWYAKGADVDALLDVGEALDWLADTGDLNETYEPPPPPPSSTCNSDNNPEVAAGGGVTHDLPEIDDDAAHNAAVRSMELGESCAVNNTSVATLPHVDSNVESVVPPLPSLFDGANSSAGTVESHQDQLTKTSMLSAAASSMEIHHQHPLKVSPSVTVLDDDLQVFENPMEEQEFVSTILENNNESSASLPILH